MATDEKRTTLIVDTLVAAFADLMEHDASAFRVKFEEFVSDLVGFAHTYAERACADHGLFVAAFRSNRIPQVGASGG